MGVLMWFHDNGTCLNWIERNFGIPHPLPCTHPLFPSPSPTHCSVDIHNTETLEMNHFPWIATGRIFFFWSFNCKSASRQMETNKAHICFIIKQVLLHQFLVTGRTNVFIFITKFLHIIKGNNYNAWPINCTLSKTTRKSKRRDQQAAKKKQGGFENYFFNQPGKPAWVLAFPPEGNCFWSLDIICMYSKYCPAHYNPVSHFGCGDSCFSPPTWHPTVRHKPVFLLSSCCDSSLLFLSNNKAQLYFSTLFLSSIKRHLNHS